MVSPSKLESQWVKVLNYICIGGRVPPGHGNETGLVNANCR